MTRSWSREAVWRHLSACLLEELFAYAYGSGTWHQIPFQFDEVEPIGNTYVVTEDGYLDANDELAFMALDAGEQAPACADLP